MWRVFTAAFRQSTPRVSLTDAGCGTDVLIEHRGIPDAVPAAEDQTGTRMALTNLARFVEADA